MPINQGFFEIINHFLIKMLFYPLIMRFLKQNFERKRQEKSAFPRDSASERAFCGSGLDWSISEHLYFYFGLLIMIISVEYTN